MCVCGGGGVFCFYEAFHVESCLVSCSHVCSAPLSVVVTTLEEGIDGLHALVHFALLYVFFPFPLVLWLAVA